MKNTELLKTIKETSNKRSGVYTALVTPFNENGAIDFEALEQLIARQSSAQIRCITLLGTTGEGATITLDERKSLFKKARSLVPSSTLLFSGCGTSSTQETIAQAKIAEEMGLDGLQISTPPYNRPSQEGLYSHFNAIHDATNLEIFLYNIPGRSACNLEIDTLKRLFELPRVTGIKEASGSLPALMEVVDLASKWDGKITVLSGDDLLALPSISLGAQGVMSVASNLLPHTMTKLVGSALAQDFEVAKAIHYQLRQFFNSCFYETNPTPMKYMLSKLGLMQNCCRLPIVPVSQATEKRIDSVLSSQPVQNAFEFENMSGDHLLVQALATV